MSLKGLYKIPLTASFLTDLAKELLTHVASSPMGLMDTMLILPTQRSIRELKKTLINLSDRPTLVLPKMIALGALEEEELGLPEMETPLHLSPLRRQVLLARLIQAFEGQGYEMTLPQAFRLASDLMGLLDQVILEGLDMGALTTLVDGNYAHHWQITLDFLTIITHHWPKILSDEGMVEPAQSRKNAICALLESWRKEPPQTPVILAGSTGSMKLTRDIMKGILALPKGVVVLPGFQSESYDIALSHSTHPQHTLSVTVKDLGVSAEKVPLWPSSSHEEHPRETLLTQAFQPELTPLAFSPSLRGVHKIEAGSEQEEALTIALIIREAVDNLNKTTLLITPDRTLARRVASCLKRWDIQVDDSSGRPLSETPPGILTRLVGEMGSQPHTPIPFLSVLKHPLVRCRLPVKEIRSLVRGLEIKGLRQQSFRGGNLLDDLRHLKLPQEIETFLTALKQTFDPFLKAAHETPVDLKTLLREQITLLETLCQNEVGEILLYKGEAGQEMARFFSHLEATVADFPPVTTSEYPALLTVLMSAFPVRSLQSTHPRVAILGPLEARLMTADRIILAGLNEGVWPMEPETGPWLSRPMRVDFGLQPLEQRVGLSAHDFTRAFAAEEIYLTRSTKVGGIPALPCRWLLRLDTLLQGTDGETQWTEKAASYLNWATKLDAPSDRVTLLPPAPTPPIHKRPRSLSVTQVEQWMRDPYSLYARHILKLKKLDPLSEDPTAADRGTLIHACLEQYKKEDKTTVEDLLDIGEQVFQPYGPFPFVQHFWWPRFQKAAPWFVTQDQHLNSAATLTEVTGQISLFNGTFTLTAKADRLDQLPGGEIALIDYKTGLLPSDRAISLGYACQLPLEGVILKHGGFSLTPISISLAFWSVTGKDEGGEIAPLKAVDELIDAAEKGLYDLIKAFDDPAMPYRCQPRPKWAPAYSDYEHLARVQEWRQG